MCSSTLVYTEKGPVLFDCGGGTTVNLLKAGIDLWGINYLFFTHHHYDHNADYGLFHQARWDLGGGKAGKLSVYGPEGTERITELLFGAEGVYANDIIVRTKWHASLWAYQDVGGELPRALPEVKAEDLFPEAVLDADGFTVTTGLGVHAQPWIDSLAYRIESGGESVVITGDTAFSSTVVHLAKGADMLVGWVGSPIESAHSAAEIAAAAGVKKLVISHLGRPGNEREAKLEADAKRLFAGPVIMAEDLMEIPVH
jgi:ribonuclease BN (tRNA processing enzyme)